MHHFVQYHNPDKFEPYKCSKLKARIVTNKPVENLVGDTVWLISRQGRPSQHVLCDTFVVEKIGSNDQTQFKNVASGAHGYWFERPALISQKPWFEKLQKATGNFSFGLQAMRDKSVIEGLEAMAASYGTVRGSPPKPTTFD